MKFDRSKPALVRRRPTLRRRLGLALVLAGGTLTITLGLLAIVAHEDLEHAVISSALDAEADHFLASHLQAGYTTLETGHLRGWLLIDHEELPAGLPQAWVQLGSGDHPAQSLGSRVYHVRVADIDGGRLILGSDTSRLDQRERQFYLLLGVGLCLFLYLSWRIGLRLARRLTDPLAQLAGQIASTEPGVRGGDLAQAYQDEELAAIAGTFDAYQHRLDDFIRREQAVTGMVSHELRTPLAVISGAADVLLSRPRASDADQRTMRRIKQATLDMRASIDALLLLGREHGQEVCEAVSVEAALEQALSETSTLITSKSVAVDVSSIQPIYVIAERRLLEIVIGNLLRNAIQHSGAGTVTIRSDATCLCIRDQGPGILPELQHQLFDLGVHGEAGHGFGLYIVQQICDRYSWHVSLENSDSGGAEAVVEFGDAAFFGGALCGEDLAGSDSVSASPKKLAGGAPTRLLRLVNE